MATRTPPNTKINRLCPLSLIHLHSKLENDRIRTRTCSAFTRQCYLFLCMYIMVTMATKTPPHTKIYRLRPLSILHLHTKLENDRTRTRTCRAFTRESLFLYIMVTMATRTPPNTKINRLCPLSLIHLHPKLENDRTRTRTCSAFTRESYLFLYIIVTMATRTPPHTKINKLRPISIIHLHTNWEENRTRTRTCRAFTR